MQLAYHYRASVMNVYTADHYRKVKVCNIRVESCLLMFLYVLGTAAEYNSRRKSKHASVHPYQAHFLPSHSRWRRASVDAGSPV